MEYQKKSSDPAIAYQSYLVQAMSMAFTYNTELVFQWLESQNILSEVLNLWFSLMDEFSTKFQLKRIIFGLSAIIRIADHEIPEVIQEALPKIMDQLTLLVEKQYNQRLNFISTGENEELPHEDFEYTSSQSLNLYDSPLDRIDSIQTVKETLKDIC